MVPIGKYNDMKINKILNFGAYLDAGDTDEILLPLHKLPENAESGDVIRVFVYKDSENRPIATTDHPKIQLNQFAFLEVKDVNKYGAFLDWGIENQLLVPFREQKEEMEAGKRYVVMMYLDRISDRLVATTKVDKHLESQPEEMEEGQEVDVLVYDETDLGYNVIVDHKYQGLVYGNEVFHEVNIGDEYPGYVKKIRDDGNIDISLRKTGIEGLQDNSKRIYQALRESHGFLPLNDKSSPNAIRDILQMSKKTFKRSIGMLYKQRIIEITDDGIRLVEFR